MSLGAATSVATTIFSYFSPAKSPYYAVIAFGVTGISFSVVQSNQNFMLVFVPVAVIVAFCTALSLSDKSNQPEFTQEDYNSQLRFARSVGISVSILCLVWAGKTITPQAEENLGWWFWLIYATTLIQAAAFLLYIFIFHRHNTSNKGINLIQLCLIVSTFQIGCAFISALIRTPHEQNEEIMVLIFYYVMWGLCMLHIGRYLMRNFKLMPPTDAELGQSDPPEGAKA